MKQNEFNVETRFYPFINALLRKYFSTPAGWGLKAVRATNLKYCILLAFAELAKPNLASKDIIIENGQYLLVIYLLDMLVFYKRSIFIDAFSLNCSPLQ